MNYSDKLKDPRWQKKRLEILNRDQWRCRFCSDEQSTLHVHHLSYSKEPWETKNEHLITLCESCHESESTQRPELEKMLVKTLKEKGYPANMLIDLDAAFHFLEDFHLPDVMGTVILWMFKNDELMKKMCETYFEELKIKRSLNNPSEKTTDDLPF